MSVANKFVDMYIEYITMRDDFFDKNILQQFCDFMIYDLFVALYWKISETYDLKYHAPLGCEDEIILLMDINIRNLFTYVTTNHEEYDVFETIPLTLIDQLKNNKFEIICDVY